MAGDDEDSPRTLSLSQARRVNDACERFEAEWREGRRADIEATLAESLNRDRRELFRELLAVEREIREMSRREADRQWLSGTVSRYGRREINQAFGM